MELLNEMLKRRSVRNYTGEPVPYEKLMMILKAGLSSPSGKNKKPWEFVVVEDREKLMELSHCRKGGVRMLEKAGCAILVFGDTEKNDVWQEDCSIAMTNMHLMASSLGLGSCWIQGRLREADNGESADAFCRRLLNVPDNFSLLALLSVGIAEEKPAPHTEDELIMSKIHRETF